MPTTCLAALIKRLRGIWERYRLRAEAAQNRRDDGHGRVYAWGMAKRDSDRKGQRGALKKFGRPYGYQGNGGGSPARRTTDFGKGGVAADIFGHKEQRLYGEEMQ